MTELDFTLEFNSPLRPENEAELFAKADTQLRQLTEGHQDMIGAAINIREPAKGESGYLYEATVVVYSRPDHVAATKKSEDVVVALKGALDGVERQIRERRDKLKKHWEQPGQGPVAQEIEEIMLAEEQAAEATDSDAT
jgi:ribosome-associated translation inhibitor RaiA